MSQSLSQLSTHIIFSTKKRFPFLQDDNIRSLLYSYIKKICHHQNCFVIAIGGMNDHIHILLNLDKKISLSDLIEKIKSSTSKWIKTVDPSNSLLKKFYWQRGYGAFSVSQSNLEKVNLYIRNQYKHHQKKTFQEELKQLLNLHNITYNEKYLWD